MTIQFCKVQNIQTGQILHEQHFMLKKEFAKDRPPPPVINLRCYDISGGCPVTMVKVFPDMVYSDVLELLEATYGQKTLFEYQDQGGRVVKVDEALRWERFCAIADDSVKMGREPTMDVFIRFWQYVEPKPFNIRTGNEGKDNAAAKPVVPHEWTSGLMQCTSAGVTTCFKGFCIPCFLSGDIARELGASWYSGCCAGVFVNSCLLRQRLRMNYNIAGTARSDCWASLCCAPCSLIQMATHTRRHKAQVNGGGNNWNVKLCDYQKKGWCRRWCWTTWCTSCAIGEIQSKLGAEEDPSCKCALSAGCCRSGCLLALCSIMACVTFQSRTNTRAFLGIEPGTYPCLTDLSVVLCCTSCALVQEAAALDLWGEAKIEGEEDEEEEEEDPDAPPKSKNCMSCLSRKKPAAGPD